MTDFDQIALDDPKNAPEVVKQMFEKGAHVVNAGNLGWSQELLKAVCREVTKMGALLPIISLQVQRQLPKR